MLAETTRMSYGRVIKTDSSRSVIGQGANKNYPDLILWIKINDKEYDVWVGSDLRQDLGVEKISKWLRNRIISCRPPQVEVWERIGKRNDQRPNEKFYVLSEASATLWALCIQSRKRRTVKKNG